MRPSLVGLRRLSRLAPALALACGGDKSPTTPPPQPAIALAISPASLELTTGSSGTVTATITPSGGFSGAVSLSAGGVPAGVTMASVTIAAGQTSGSLSVAAAAGAAVGAATVTIQASATGVATQTATLALKVTAAPGSFALALAPATLPLQADASAVDTVKIARTGSFAGAVGVSVTGAPSGMTLSLDAASVTGTSTLLRIATTASVTPGTYTLTVSGTGSGVSSQTATLTVTVTAPASPNVSYTFCGQQPIWVAAQDGSGPWTRMTSSSNTYAFHIGTQGALAWVLGDSANGYHTYVTYGSAQDLQGQPATNCPTSVLAKKTVNGSVLGLAATERALVSLSGVGALVQGGGSGAFTVRNVPGGNVDLLAVRSSPDASFTYIPNKVWLQRNLNPADGSTLAPIDFTSALAFAPVTNTLTIGNLGAQQAQTHVSLVTQNGTSSVEQILSGTSVTVPFVSLPTSALQTGDMQLVDILAYTPSNNPTSFRMAGRYYGTPTDVTLTLGSEIVGATPSVVATAPYLRVGMNYTPQPGYGTSATAEFYQGTGPGSEALTVVLNLDVPSGLAVNYVGMPDLSGADGWKNDWALKSGSQTTWFMEQYAKHLAPVGVDWDYAIALAQGMFVP